MTQSALIVGAGSGLSAALARRCAREGMRVTLVARRADKLAALAAETQARVIAADAAQPAEVDRYWAETVAKSGVPDLVVFNPSFRVRGAFAELDREAVLKTLMVSCYGGFLLAHAAAKPMLARGSGSLFFTGASASVKGYAESAPFAMGKFGLRGLAQSLAREWSPRNIHVAHFVIDGGILQDNDQRAGARGADGMLLPDAIAETYWHIHRQHRSAWTWEVELRPWVEKF